MGNHEEQLAAIQEMRDMMDQASRFKSISGLSGILAGILSLFCVFLAYQMTGISPFESEALDRMWNSQHKVLLVALFCSLFGICIGIGIFMAMRNARLSGKRAWDNAAKRLTFSLAIPVLSGGIFAILLMQIGLVALTAPITLLFYGLGLLSASKFTLDTVQPVGLLFIILGLLAAAFLAYGLLIWALGFGLVHILYGFIIYIRYERV